MLQGSPVIDGSKPLSQNVKRPIILVDMHFPDGISQCSKVQMCYVLIRLKQYSLQKTMFHLFINGVSLPPRDSYNVGSKRESDS